MASSKEKRSQRHQSQPKQNVTQANPRAKVTEQVAGSGYRETQFIGGKKYYTPLSTNPNIAISGSSSVSTGVGGSSSVGISSHGALVELLDDDHTQYVLVDGTRAFSGNWTNAGRTVADLGIITTVDINGGTIDGAAIGANSATTIVGTTIDATTDFTIGTLVITDDQIQMTPSDSDTVTIAGASNGELNITAVDGGGANANITITADGDITLDSADSIILDTAGSNNDVLIKNGGTERFAFKNDGNPELDVTGAFTLDGSASITIDSVGETIINTNGNSIIRASLTGSLFLHGATDAPTNYYACGIQMKKNIYHFSTGHEDFKENFTMLNMYEEPSQFVAYPS